MNPNHITTAETGQDAGLRKLRKEHPEWFTREPPETHLMDNIKAILKSDDQKKVAKRKKKEE